MPESPHDETRDFQSSDAAQTVAQSSEQRALSALLMSAPRIAGYEILGEIGRGGMGVVFKARQIQANRTVALKMILAGDFAGATDIERFRIEVVATAQLKHPGIVQVYEVGEHQGRPFFSMELCDGGSLAQKGVTGPMKPAAAAAVVERIARAVECAHLAGIVHRDLKPGNILIGEDGTPKVGDFGMAKQLQSDSGQTQSGAVMGTPSYMAPEQAAGLTKTVGPPADVYAIGVILFELLTGQLPFQAENIPALLQRVMHDEPPTISGRGVPRDLDTICRKCLAKEPERRYATAGELAEDLRRFQSGESISARQLNAVARIAWMLERSQFDKQFARFSGFFLWLVPIMLVPEIIATIVRFEGGTVWEIVPYYTLRPVFGISLFLYYGGGRIWPSNPAEQHILSVFGGFVVVAGLLFVNLAFYKDGAEWNGAAFYQAVAAASAMAFFSLGAMFWGGCYIIGFTFFMFIPLMPFDPRLCPLEYGMIWASVALVVGLRLRRIGRDQQ